MNRKVDSKSETKMTNKEYTKELRHLQAELCMLQEWVKYKGMRAIVVFEGRDAAGKGGTIRAITERVSPRVFRVVAMPRRPIGKRASSTCSDTFRTCRLLARS